jgi:hypothetical protein
VRPFFSLLFAVLLRRDFTGGVETGASGNIGATTGFGGSGTTKWDAPRAIRTPKNFVVSMGISGLESPLFVCGEATFFEN